MKKLIDLEVREKVLVAAHRGASGELPENTIPAFEQAIADGVDMIETDVQCTADGLIITYHDLSVSEGSGLINIQETNYSDLPIIVSNSENKINASPPPLLRDLFRIVKDKVYLIIEIKEINNKDYRDVIKQIHDLSKEEGVNDQILLSSFYIDYIKYSKIIEPNIPVAAIKIPFRNDLPSDLKYITNCEAFICSVDELNYNIFKDIENNQIFTGVYSVDNEQTLRKALDYNVNAVATNFPKKIIDLLANL
jgi:glycerophosphoryl diester phosphodiesterase